MREYEIKKGNVNELITFKELNNKGEKIQVEISKSIGDDSSLMKTWVKNKYLKHKLETWWSIQVYATNKDGLCLGKYNPTVKLAENHKRLVINFDWMLEATEENKIKILNEIERLAFKE